MNDLIKKQRRFYISCNDNTLTYSQKNYEKFYLKNGLIELIPYNKPIIVTATVEVNPYDYYYSFINVKPFYPDFEKSSIVLCGHINIPKEQVDTYINFFNIDYNNQRFVLICKPYIYYNEDNEARGGLNLTTSLNVNPILFYEEAVMLIKNIPKHCYIDFFEHRNGHFLGINSDLIVKQNNQKRTLNKYLRKQQRKQDKINYPFLNRRKMVI